MGRRASGDRQKPASERGLADLVRAKQCHSGELPQALEYEGLEALGRSGIIS